MFLQDPVFLSAVVATVGAIGLAAALRGVGEVAAEKTIVDQTTPHIGGLIAVQRGETTTDAWLLHHGVPQDSHVADHVIAFVGGWRSGRLPTLGELHNLAARRERNRTAARVASGIVATLLIFGIAGTLLSIHPVLKQFTIPIAPDGSTQEAAKGAADVMSMIHGLGTAFFPSLCALVATIIVVSIRGWYSIRASKLSQTLDRFSLAYLFPVFRLRSFAEDFVKVESNLLGLVDAIKRRDKGFEEAVGILKSAADSFEDAAPKLKKTADAVAKASEKLAADAELVFSGMTEQFSEHSELVQTLRKSAGAMERAAAEASKLVDATKAIDARHQQLALSFTQNASAMKQAVDSVSVQVAAGVASGKGIIVDAAKGVVEDVARAAKARVAKEVEPIIEELGRAGGIVGSAVSKLAQDVDSITSEIRGSADAANHAVGETSRSASEMIERASRESVVMRDEAKLQLGEAASELKTTGTMLNAELTSTWKRHEEAFAGTVGAASANIATAARDIASANDKLESIVARIEDLPAAASSPLPKKRWFHWLRRRA